MSESARSRKARIFVAEDNPADVYLVRLALEESGIESELEVAAHGDRALEILERFPPEQRPDLILMDLNLPGKGGIDILTRLRETKHCQGVPVVVMTSSSATSDREAAERLGVNHYFRKATHLHDFMQLGTIVKDLL